VEMDTPAAFATSAMPVDRLEGLITGGLREGCREGYR
jgi:hypothetical protein